MYKMVNYAYAFTKFAEPIKFPVSANFSFVLGSKAPNVIRQIVSILESLFSFSGIVVRVTHDALLGGGVLSVSKVVLLIHRVPLVVTVLKGINFWFVSL